MNRLKALTFIYTPKDMSIAWLNSFSQWGIEWTAGKEHTGNPNCKKNGVSQLVCFIDKPNVAFYKKLFSDRPKPMVIDFLANVSAWYDNGEEEIHIDVNNVEEYRDLVDDWLDAPTGKYNPPIDEI